MSRRFIFAFVNLVSLSTCLGLPALLQAQSEDSSRNPYEQGTRRTPLTESQKESFLKYSVGSKSLLKAALEDAKGKPFEEANDIYLMAIKGVVFSSDAKDLRTELLMRYALDQALDLTYGIPRANGHGYVSEGVLRDVTNRDLITLILEDSIRLAIQYADADYGGIQKGSLIDLPYEKMAFDRLKLARKWLSLTFEWNASYDLAVRAVYHWALTVGDREHLHQEKYGLLLVKADDLLNQEQVGKRFNNPQDLVKKVRNLRKFLRQLAESERENSSVDDAPSEATSEAPVNGNHILMVSVDEFVAAVKHLSSRPANKTIEEYSEHNLSSLSLDDFGKLLKALQKYESLYEDDEEFGRKQVFDRMYVAYAGRYNHMELSQMLSFVDMLKIRPKSEYEVQVDELNNLLIEGYVGNNVARLSVSQAMLLCQKLRSRGSYDKDNFTGRRQTQDRIMQNVMKNGKLE